jgi:hypothetical protein
VSVLILCRLQVGDTARYGTLQTAKICATTEATNCKRGLCLNPWFGQGTLQEQVPYNLEIE